ncbi:Rhodopsin kinase GRK7 [Dissostichus eleginoides]|uniref:Rhodopsin kinase GRK7 n=1 Tax=Dissostichus eleginoides TaxID=100907 RepID=A0AAD9BXV2_DISEL|nr:Rhodopsin kinase GRK7 [Dissostichus eleginoides]
MKELLCWCQSQMPSTTSTLLRLQSPLTRSGRGPADLQVAPLAGKPDPARPHSYLFHKLRSKCRRWQIRPGSGTASLQQLLSRNSPSMPC